jgi:hypothetical protein
VQDSYRQPDGTAQVEAAITPIATYAEEAEVLPPPTDAAYLIIDTFRIDLGKRPMRITRRRLRNSNPP